MESPYYFDTLESPVGQLMLLASDRGLCALLFGHQKNQPGLGSVQAPHHPHLAKAKKQLNEYFAGARREFDLPLAPKGTIFQLKAWKELQKIAYGETISYGEQARRMGDAKKARAAGIANSRNPLAIIIPCHRVIGADGTLTGYAGGLDIKSALLAHEQKHLSQRKNAA